MNLIIHDFVWKSHNNLRNTVVLAFLARYRPHTVAVPMGRRYLNVTPRSKIKDAVLKRPIAY